MMLYKHEMYQYLKSPLKIADGFGTSTTPSFKSCDAILDILESSVFNFSGSGVEFGVSCAFSVAASVSIPSSSSSTSSSSLLSSCSESANSTSLSSSSGTAVPNNEAKPPPVDFPVSSSSLSSSSLV
ncbi:hypothetical protein WICMUC_003731 [Wickerhamomyces mucosus]|uniref:Uncharacterized protein n=1 Tax=Wickerhamomyces mucosus TaxID=1378264 RepID=A0A9P8PKZ3_9ASCO|nr:hypothetical protein WICMUC_003731 [Wickerhamomyces mucosus]